MVSLVDEDFWVAAGYDGVVYKTSDRGATWQSIGYPNLTGDLLAADVKFITHDLGYVTGNRLGESQNLYRTTNGGASWAHSSSIGNGNSIDFIDANRGWMMNAGGTGFRTMDGGGTRQQMILPNQGLTPLTTKMDFINENVGWAVGWYGYAAHTVDGGVTWKLQNISASDEISPSGRIFPEQRLRYFVGEYLHLGLRRDRPAQGWDRLHPAVDLRGLTQDSSRSRNI